MTSANTIYTGFWVDHSKGTVLGGTLTYGTTWGSQLITTTALLVQLTGASIWMIVAFGLHQHWATRAPYDEFEAQRQIQLRNTGSPLGAVLSLYDLGSMWHGHRPGAWRSALSFMILPFSVFAIFTVAGVFVGQIAESGQVLLRPGLCGRFAPGYSPTVDIGIAGLQLLTNISQVASSYARDCYAMSTSDAVTCSSFAKPQLPYNVSRTAPCPIGPGNCAISDHSAMSFQIPLLDSHYDLGINSVPSNRVQFGYRATCAPIFFDLQKSFTSSDNDTGLRNNNGVYPTYHLNFGSGVNGFIPLNYSSVLARLGSQAGQYSINSWQSYYPHNGSQLGGTIIPYAPFNLSVADITIHVVSANSISYIERNTDPIFGTESAPYYNGNGFVLYRPSRLLNVLTCAQTYQVCNGNTSCTDWAPAYTVNDRYPSLGFNAAQKATLLRIFYGIAGLNMFLSASIASPLKASDYVLAGSPGVSEGLTNGQWMQEVEGWFQTVLAGWQYLAQAYPNIPHNIQEKAAAYGIPIIHANGSDPEALAQCSQQRVQTPAGYTSYSVFALVFVLVMTIIFTSLSLWLTRFNHRLPGRRPGGKNHPKLLAYQADGLLQLHRMALEGAGYGGWRSGKDGLRSVPYTDVAQKRLQPAVLRTNSEKLSNPQESSDDIEGHALIYYDNTIYNSVGGQEADVSYVNDFQNSIPGELTDLSSDKGAIR